MERTIHQLLAAKAAGDPISDTDLERLQHHARELQRAFGKLAGYMARQKFGEWAPGTEFERLREGILRDLEAKDAPELRDIVHLLLAVVEFGDCFVAQASGQDHRQRALRRRGGQQSSRSRRSSAESLVIAIDAIKARNPVLTDEAAVRSHLVETESDWMVWTDVERERKVKARARRLRRGRKNTGRELS